MPAKHFRPALLSSESVNIHDCKSKDFDIIERFLNGFQFGWLNDGENELHDWAQKKNEARQEGRASRGSKANSKLNPEAGWVPNQRVRHWLVVSQEHGSESGERVPC